MVFSFRAFGLAETLSGRIWSSGRFEVSKRASSAVSEREGGHAHTQADSQECCVFVCVCVGGGRKLSPLMGPPHCSPIMPRLFQDKLRAPGSSKLILRIFFFYYLKSFLIPFKTAAARYKLSTHKFILHTVCNQVSRGGLDLASVTLPSVSSLPVGGGTEAPAAAAAARCYLGK